MLYGNNKVNLAFAAVNAETREVTVAFNFIRERSVENADSVRCHSRTACSLPPKAWVSDQGELKGFCSHNITFNLIPCSFVL